ADRRAPRGRSANRPPDQYRARHRRARKCASRLDHRPAGRRGCHAFAPEPGPPSRRRDARPARAGTRWETGSSRNSRRARGCAFALRKPWGFRVARPPARRHGSAGDASRPRFDQQCGVARRGQRSRAWRGAWAHPGAAGRGRCRRQLLQQEPAAVARRGNRHAACAGNLRRRGQGQPRCHGRPARRKRVVLPALARRPAGNGAAHPGARILFGRAGRNGTRAAARTLRGAAGGTASGGFGMNETAKDMKPSEQTVDWAAIRRDFPILQRKVHGKPLVYLDSANTSQKPRQVIEAVDDFYRNHNANVSRAVHQLGEEATALYEGARDKLAAFLGANHRDEIVLTSGTTMATNLVAYSYLLPRLKPGDAVLVTAMEHHADIVPWQLICKLTGAHLKVAPITASGELIVEQFIAALTPEVKFAGVVHVSNVLGTVNPVKELARECRKRGIPLLVDGSQAAPHLPLDVKSIGCDFYCVTGHKMCG